MNNNESKENNPIMKDTKKLILKNSIVALLIILSCVGIYVVYSILQDSMFSRVWQGLTMLLLFLSIAIFEIAYKKDSGVLAINGIEILVFACYVLTLEYVKKRYGLNITLYVIIVCIAFVVYYLFKTFIIYTTGRKKVLNSLSDIADIVKEDEPKRKKAIKRKKGED